MSPDHAEEESAGEMDNIVPGLPYNLLPVVGLGGSAGSIGAFKTFFSQMAPDSGMAFVVVLHLSPEHESILASLLQNVTKMPVIQVNEPVKMEPNHVYVIPPGKHLSMSDGTLRLFDFQQGRGKRVVVDLLFRTMADTHGPRAMCVILSGADGDGAIGLKRVKERGGLTVAQDPGEAEHDGMPRAAIATGMVDWVLPVVEMPARLLEYQRNERRLRLPGEEPPSSAAPPDDESALREVLAFLRMRTGRDFSSYKRATVLRRIGRRMQVNGLPDLPDYLVFLRTHPGESGALLQDLLISVTNFFRDRESFQALEREIPRLFKGKRSGDQVRVWTTGCATGEEAYSIAMLLCEHAAQLDAPPSLQVFATDIDESAIRSSREGLYPENIVADVSPERLRRFFFKDQGGYRVQRAVREIVLFAPHDLLKDSPFSRLDLITCRNLLIYFNRQAQARAFDVFHFALRPDGLLFLGTSESADDAPALFTPLDKKHRLYARHAAPRQGLPLFNSPSSLSLALNPPSVAYANPRLTAALPAAAPVSEGGHLSWGELHFKLLERLAPPSLIVDGDHNIIHLSEHAGAYLQFGGGEPTMNLLRVIHPMLRIELRTALFRAGQTGSQAEARDLPVEIAGERRTVNLRVRPAQELSPGFLFVVIDESASPAPETAAPQPTEPLARQLERELDQLKSQQREMMEQYEASTEELKASNEELQSMNEELRSATEELETSREELQSINEELVTVNHELKTSVEELGRANSDLQNLMSSTDIATVFLDRELRIKRYTPVAVDLFNLIPTDVGRPLSDLRHRLEYDAIAADAERVLDHLSLVEREVRSPAGCWFLARLLPYRTAEDRIAGVVLTFVDITRRKQAEESRRESEERFHALVQQATVGVAQADLTGRLIFVNQRYYEITGYSEEEALTMRMLDITHPEDRTRNGAWFERMAQEGASFEIEKRYVRKDGSAVWVHDNVAPIRGQDGQIQSCFAVTIEITERKQAEQKFLALQNVLASELAAMIRLHDLSTRLLATSELQPLLNEVLDATIEIQNADFGGIQLLDQQTNRLKVVAQRGFSREAVDYFDEIEDGAAVCHQALDRRERIFIDDVLTNPVYEPHRHVAIDVVGFRSIQFTPLFDRAGEPLGVLSTQFRQPHRPSESELRLTDLYARQAAELIGFKLSQEKVRVSEERYRLIFENARDFAILSLDASGTITSWNPGAEAIFGYTAAEAIGQSAAILFTPEDRSSGVLQEEMAVAVRTGSASEDRWHRRRDGSRFWGSGVLTPMIEDGHRMGFLKILRDRTAEQQAREDRRQAEDERAGRLIAEQNARQEAEAANKAKDHFLATLSHEMRAPLAPMQMAVFALQREDNLSDTGWEMLEMIRRNMETETRLIDDLLDVSRIVHGKLELRRVPIDLHACIKGALEVCQGDIDAKALRLAVDLHAGRHEVSGDASRLQQVFWNLLKNAAKFTPEGGAIAVRSSNLDGRILVEVRDSGVGIEPAALAKIFSAFEQGGSEITQRYGGLGLGLAISHAIICAHQGELTAASAGPGQGAAFMVALSTI